MATIYSPAFPESNQPDLNPPKPDTLLFPRIFVPVIVSLENGRQFTIYCGTKLLMVFTTFILGDDDH